MYASQVDGHTDNITFEVRTDRVAKALPMVTRTSGSQLVSYTDMPSPPSRGYSEARYLSYKTTPKGAGEVVS